jgi:aspartyl-tRNA(Asn)/glutamyl-tRNA(Gln) amidotransferase subunit A
MIAFASSLDQGGPFAQTAQDAAMLLNAMSGFDPLDSTSVDTPVPDYTKTLNESLAGKTIGVPKEYFENGLDKTVQARIQEAIGVFEKLGARIKEVSLPSSPLSISVYYVVASAECSSNLSRFDGVRFGHRCDNPRDLEDLYKRSRSEGFGDEVKRRIMVGTYALSSGYYDAYYLKAQKVRKLIADDFKRAFEQVDLLIGPTTPTPAFKIGEKTDDPVSMYLSDIYTIATNLAGLPGLSIPAGFVNDLPIGIQLTGKHFDESALLNAAHKYQQETDWHKQIPKSCA